ncbi:cysteine--tRNA ligase [bacterium]|nr:cysteine--tRNA ligase [bacterium]
MIKLHNTLSNQMEEFIPLNDKNVTMYVCGPTVYDYPHLGHARCYITWDILYRYLKFAGYNVKYCRNVTDVDDKILAKAHHEGVSASEISSRYYEIFSDAMKKLNNLQPDFEPRATKTIGEMIALIKILISKGYAYEIDGDVYFRVKNFKEYGKLSKQPIDDLEAGARVETSSKKEDALDFALWKKDEVDGYKSPWGIGRPGWHIECSAMSKKYLGEQIDIHAGGADLIFPHHENEIAQSECASGKQFVKYWLHNGFVTINKEKMSKSLKNFVTINSLLEHYDADTIRFFILTNHYRMPVEFNNEALNSAKTGFKRLQTTLDEVISFAEKDNLIPNQNSEEIEKFKKAMNNDLNTSVALSVLFDLSTKANSAKANNDKILAGRYVSELKMLMDVLGFTCKKSQISEEELNKRISTIIDELNFIDDRNTRGYALLDAVIAVRANARKEKNWELADKIRTIFDKIGIIFKDGKDKTIWLEKE